MVLFTLIGVAGLLCLLLAFFLAESGKMTSLHKYTWLNATGSFFLIIYSIHILAWVFTILNVIWFVVAVAKLVRLGKGGIITPLLPHHDVRAARVRRRVDGKTHKQRK